MSRNSLLAQIHIARKDMVLDEGTYRALLMRIAKKDSGKDCTVPDLVRIISEFKRLGWKQKAKTKGKSIPFKGKDPRNVALALWIELHKAGAVRDPSDNALASYASRMAKVDHWRWLDDEGCYVVIESLKSWLARTLDKQKRVQ